MLVESELNNWLLGFFDVVTGVVGLVGVGVGFGRVGGGVGFGVGAGVFCFARRSALSLKYSFCILLARFSLLDVAELNLTTTIPTMAIVTTTTATCHQAIFWCLRFGLFTIVTY